MKLYDDMLGLANVGGTLCVTCLMAKQDEPLFIRVYWPTMISVATLINIWPEKVTRDNLETIKVVRSKQGGGVYAIYPDYEDRNGYAHWGIGTPIETAQGGATMSIKSDVIENPRPKTKRECRYRNGRWQLLFKTGWKDA